MKDSLARATPFFSQMMAGNVVTDKEIKMARIGFLEPLVLAQATTSREVVALTEEYQKNAEQMKLAETFVPRNLSQPDSRFQLRMTLKRWVQTCNEYKSQIDAATARGKLASQATLSTMPRDFAKGAENGLSEAADQTIRFVSATVAAELDAVQGMVSILDLLDGKPDGFLLGKSSPQSLMFRDDAMLATYRQQVTKVVEAGARQQQERERYLQWQSSRAGRLGEFLKN